MIKPMLAQKVNTKPIDWTKKVFVQPKLDGIRCIAMIRKGKCTLWSRTRKPIKSMPHIVAELERQFKDQDNVVLDGELYNHELKDDFNSITSMVRKTKLKPEDLEKSKELVQYHVYDVISPEPMSYDERMQFLKENIADLFDSVSLVPTATVNDLDEAESKLGEYLEAGYEGQMLRKVKARYEHRRSASLIKHKMFEDEEFKIVEVIEGKGNWAGHAKAVEIMLEDGTTQQSGMRGNFDFAKKILEEKDLYIGTEVTVRYQNRTSDNKLRFPVVVAFWKGKRDI